MSESNKFVGGAITLVVVVVILALTGVIGSAMLGAVGDATEEHRASDVEIQETGEVVSFDNSNDISESTEQVDQVRDTTGYALEFYGNGYVESNEKIELLHEDEWTVSTSVWINEDVDLDTEEMTIVAIGDPNLLIQYDGGEWTAHIYTISESAEVSVAATDPTNRTSVTVANNGDEYSIYEQTADGEVVGSSAPVDEPETPTSSNIGTDGLVGTIDETRVFSDALDATQRDSLYSSPAAGVEGADEIARLMYDEGAGDTTRVYWASTDATIESGHWTDGVEPTVLEEGVDYEVDEDSGEIVALEGGRLSGGSIAHIGYQLEVRHFVGPISHFGNVSMILFSVGLLLIPVAAILVYLHQQVPINDIRGTNR